MARRLLHVLYLLGALSGCDVAAAAAAAAAGASPIIADQTMKFPADYGSHPDFRTEWWYVTGWLSTSRGESLGFQVTFFRSKTDIDGRNPSAFAPRQLLIAHCAVSDPTHGRLWQDQRIRRAGLGLAQAMTGDTQVWIDRWRLQRESDSYRVAIDADDFHYDLTLATTQPPLLNGENGVSRKGSTAGATSHYYSEPHLRVAGTVARGPNSGEQTVSGEAWLDHEWSNEYLEVGAVGWDWIGINLDDGSALMAFRIRGAQGEPRWAGGSIRSAQGAVQILPPAAIVFHPVRRWVSPRSGIAYPVQWSIQAGSRRLELLPLMDDQENDTRISTGAIYWEGAVRAYEGHRVAGRGYLELTGYGEPLRLRRDE